MNRLRVEGLLAAFPKLVGLTSKQHTFVETDSVRYVYQPLENNLYLLLITTKASNIVEDLGTLRLLAKVVPDVAGGLQEHTINEHAFELIFAFDEVLTAGGYKEEASLSSIRTNLLMDSHEEKIAIALRQSREEQARQEMQAKAKSLQEQKMANLRQTFVTGQAPVGNLGGMEGFGGGGGHPGHGGGGIFDQMQQQQQGFGAPQEEFNPYAALQKRDAPAPTAPKVLAKSGMKLGGMGGGKKDSLMAAMAAEDNLFGGSKGAAAADFGFGAPIEASVAPPSTPLSLVLEEKISCNMTREGAVEACEVKGILNLTANTDVGAAAIIAINKAQLPAMFNYATHPKVDKKDYEQKGVLSLKGGKGFPVGRAVGILRWSYSGEDAAPITINCWPEQAGSGMMTVNVEMEMTRSDLVLNDVNILFPLGTTEPPSIENIDGQYKHDPRAGMMCWHFDTLDAGTNSGSLEFSIPGNSPDAFFPIQIGFRSETLMCPITLTGITNVSTGAPIPNQVTKSFVPESYQCA